MKNKALCLTTNRTIQTELEYKEGYAEPHNCQEDYPNWFFMKKGSKKKHKFYCKTWSCITCYDRQRRKLKRNIIEVAQQKNLKFFITMTIDHKVCSPLDSYDKISNCWNKFTTIIRRQLNDSNSKFDYIKIVESHKNGYAHIHFLTNKFFDVTKLRALWHKLGGGKQLRIEPVVEMTKISNYLSKYMTKDSVRLPKGKRHYSMAKHLNKLILKPKTKGNYKLVVELYIEGWRIIREVCKYDFVFNSDYLSNFERMQKRSTLSLIPTINMF